MIIECKRKDNLQVQLKLPLQIVGLIQSYYGTWLPVLKIVFHIEEKLLRKV